MNDARVAVPLLLTLLVSDVSAGEPREARGRVVDAQVPAEKLREEPARRLEAAGRP
ncbi:MAG: hypothetical protein U0790_12640 [Isosphaeraceae bacterium]